MNDNPLFAFGTRMEVGRFDWSVGMTVGPLLRIAAVRITEGNTAGGEGVDCGVHVDHLAAIRSSFCLYYTHNHTSFCVEVFSLIRGKERNEISKQTY
jgi:hypothetical protein